MQFDETTTILAKKFRVDNELSLDRPINLIDLLYSIDVVSVFMPLSNGFCGMSQIENGRKFMLVNSNHSLGRQNFTICHEIYHLFFQENFSAQICASREFDDTDQIEYTADCFAADLLIPEFGITREIPVDELRHNRIKIPTLLKIEHKYRCSRTALLYRLKEMKFIDNDKFDQLEKNVKNGAEEHGYSTSLYLPTKEKLKVIGKYGQLARSKFEDNRISESHYISLMHDIGIDLGMIEWENVE